MLYNWCSWKSNIKQTNKHINTITIMFQWRWFTNIFHKIFIMNDDGLSKKRVHVYILMSYISNKMLFYILYPLLDVWYHTHKHIRVHVVIRYIQFFLEPCHSWINYFLRLVGRSVIEYLYKMILLWNVLQKLKN